MGFNNGYDSGYSDALEDVRNGRVAGLGPASGGGGAAPAVSFSLRPNVMYIKPSPGTGEIKGTVDSTDNYPSMVAKVDPDDILSALSDGEAAVLALDAPTDFSSSAGDLNTFYIDGYTQKMVADDMGMGPVADGEDPGGGRVLISGGVELPAVLVAKVGSGLIVKALNRMLYTDE